MSTTKKLAVGDKIAVKRDGEIHQATIKRIGVIDSNANDYRSNSHWVMLTLDVHGAVGYCVAKREELADI